jgi:electron transport complex protein RnfG
MKETVRLIGVLAVICLIAGALLAAVNIVTLKPIAAAAREEKMAAIRTVLPDCNNEPDADAVTIEVDGAPWTFYIGLQDGQFVGAAFESVSPKGYGGDVAIMVGVNAEGNVQAIEILAQKETPGLGAKMADDEFKSQFAGRSVADTAWAVDKDQGDIDSITAATISSRAVVEAVSAGLKVYTAYQAEIVK